MSECAIRNTGHPTEALALTLGVFLEWYQTTVPCRYGTLSDNLLNTLVVVLGPIAALLPL